MGHLQGPSPPPPPGAHVDAWTTPDAARVDPTIFQLEMMVYQCPPGEES
ncbi:hypothetical protein [Pyrolobus fumarii]|nr:hypothetical protein [Pyrolobus fumarii]